MHSTPPTPFYRRQNENDDEMVREEIDDNVDRPAAEETPANGGLVSA